MKKKIIYLLYFYKYSDHRSFENRGTCGGVVLLLINIALLPGFFRSQNTAEEESGIKTCTEAR